VTGTPRADGGQRTQTDVDSVAEYIRRLVDAAPPLTAARRDHLAQLLTVTTAGRAA
jgi:hypothetical protein